MLLGLLATLSLAISAERAYLESEGVKLAKNNAIARLNAISCVDIAQLRIFLNENPVLGNYFTGRGYCSVDEVRAEQNFVRIKTSATEERQQVAVEARLDGSTSELLSIYQKDL